MKQLRRTHRDHTTVTDSPSLRAWAALSPRQRAHAGTEARDWADPWTNAGRCLPVMQRWHGFVVRVNVGLILLAALLSLSAALAIIHRPYPVIVLVRPDGTLVCPPAAPLQRAGATPRQAAACARLLGVRG